MYFKNEIPPSPLRGVGMTISLSSRALVERSLRFGPSFAYGYGRAQRDDRWDMDSRSGREWQKCIVILVPIFIGINSCGDPEKTWIPAYLPIHTAS